MHGHYTFNNQQTALPSTQGQNLSGGAVGLPYASFPARQGEQRVRVESRLEPNWHKPATSVFVQDTWRVKSALTIDYGLTVGSAGVWLRRAGPAQHVLAGFANPAAGGLLGATIYEGDGSGACNCRFVKTYPYSFGPRVGASYQINPRTVLRGGWGLTYAQTGNGEAVGGSTLGAGGWNTINFQSPAFGEPGALLRNGLGYSLDELLPRQQQPRHTSVAGTNRRTAAVDSPRRRQDAQAQPVERLPAARDHARPGRRRRICRQSR